MRINNNGNVLVNSLLTLILAAIILTSISTSAIGSFLLQDKMYETSKEVKQARIATQVLVMDVENELNETRSIYNFGTLHSFLNQYTSTDSFCTYDSNNKNNGKDIDIFPITCTVGGAVITTNIVVVKYAPSLYNYVLGTDGDLYLNGTSFIGGNSFAESMYISNHTLNGESVTNLESIDELLDDPLDPSTQYNYVHFNKGLTIGTNIYTTEVYGCYADKLNGCYTANDTNIVSNSLDFPTVTNTMTQFTHEINYGTELPIMNTDYNIDIPDVNLGDKVDDIFYQWTDIKNNADLGSTLDPYSSTIYDRDNDILCYTDIYDSKSKKSDVGESYDCKNKSFLHYSNSNTINVENTITKDNSTISRSSNSLINTVFADITDDEYQVTVNPSVTELSPITDNILYIDGDLVINDMNSSLELGGTIIVKGDVLINGSMESLKLTGTLYSFGKIDINLTDTERGIVNGDSDFGFMFAKEHIIINANRNFHGVDEEVIDYNMNGYFYAEGSILIETDKNSSINVNGGLYAKGSTNPDFPEIEIDGREFIFDGIMINSYSGKIIDSHYYLDRNPYKSRFVVKPHQSSDDVYQAFIDRLDVPTEFKDPIGPEDFVTAYKEVVQ